MVQVEESPQQRVNLPFDRFAAALFFVAVSFAACLMPAQSDTWWQLRAGKEILDTGTISLRDSFSHTVGGGYWPDHEWLSQVIFYALYRAGGMSLLTGVAAAVVTITWFIVWRLIPGRPLVRVGLCALALGPVATEWSLRPQVFTLLLLALTALFLVRRRYAFLPPLFLLWANLHGGVMLGVVLVTAAAMVAVVAERRLLIRPVIVAGICGLMTAMTPLGFSVWTEIPESLDRLREYGVQEWRPPDIRDPVLLPFWMLAAAFVVLLVQRKPWRAPAVTDVLLWGSVALFPIALSASRNIPALEVVMLPALGGLIEAAFPHRAGSLRRREHPTLNASVVLVATLVAVLAVVYAWASEIRRLGWRPIPRGVIAALEACPERLYNRYDDGGYVIWFVPDRKVFIDSRQDPFPPELVREHIHVETSGEYGETFRRYSIRCAFVPANSVLMRRLTTDNWQALYKDATWAVLVQ
jgi:hypothetical protein